MAKQNFLAGNYIGKLGDTIGQRWKDKHIIRAYTKPKNPRTPAQQAMRADFKMANQLAQQAMNINGGQGFWDTSKTPEYSQRVGQAMRMLRQGVPPDQALPLYPVAPEQAKNITVASVLDTGNDTIQFTLAGFANLPIAKVKGTVYFVPTETYTTYETMQADETFDTQTGTFEIYFQDARPGDNTGFFPVGLDLKVYDANDAEIVSAAIDWNHFETDGITTFLWSNFREDLQITGQAILPGDGDYIQVEVDTVQPSEATQALYFFGQEWLADEDDVNEYGYGDGDISAASLPATIDTSILQTAGANGVRLTAWAAHKVGDTVWCHGGNIILRG